MCCSFVGPIPFGPTNEHEALSAVRLPVPLRVDAVT